MNENISSLMTRFFSLKWIISKWRVLTSYHSDIYSRNDTFSNVHGSPLKSPQHLSPSDDGMQKTIMKIDWAFILAFSWSFMGKIIMYQGFFEFCFRWRKQCLQCFHELLSRSNGTWQSICKKSWLEFIFISNRSSVYKLVWESVCTWVQRPSDARAHLRSDDFFVKFCWKPS